MLFMNATGLDSKTSVARPAIGILLAAVVLGVAYNSFSPLGVRAPRPEETSTVSAPSPAATIPSPPVPVAPPPAPAVPAPIPTPAVAQPQFPELKWAEVKTLLAQNKIVLVDARLKATYDISHIPGAISLPATSPAVELQAFATKYPKDTRFVTYCSSESCDMSLTLAQSLYKICGYTNVSHMPGGFVEYQTAEAANAK